MASRCSTALVEPPNAMVTAMAFSNASLVRICRAVMPRRSSSTAAMPLRRAKPSRRRSTAGGAADPGSDMPERLRGRGHGVGGVHAAARPLAGQMAFSISVTCSRVIRPRTQAPTASKASMIVTSRSPTRPGMIEPA